MILNNTILDSHNSENRKNKLTKDTLPIDTNIDGIEEKETLKKLYNNLKLGQFCEDISPSLNIKIKN